MKKKTPIIRNAIPYYLTWNKGGKAKLSPILAMTLHEQ